MDVLQWIQCAPALQINRFGVPTRLLAFHDMEAMASYMVLGVLAIHVAIAKHAGGLATSIMDGVDSLGLSDIWELQANNGNPASGCS